MNARVPATPYSTPGGTSVHLRTYLAAIRRRWLLITLAIVAAVGGAAFVTFSATKQYESTALMFVSNTQAGTSEALAVTQLTVSRITSYADLATTPELAARVIDEQDMTDIDADELASHVKAEPVPETVILRVSFTDPDPREAQRLAQAYAEALVEMITELETPVANPDASPIKASIVGAAGFPDEPTSPRPVRNLALGLLLGIVGAAALTVLRELLDTTIKSPEDLAKQTDAPLLGTIPLDKRQIPINELDLGAPTTEAYRVLRTNIQFVGIDQPTKVFVITSPLPGDGKTVTSVNLAMSLALAGRRVLLVEADLRRPRASKTLGLDRSVGFTSALLGMVPLNDAVQIHAETGLHVLASGPLPPNPAELLQTQAMARLVQTIRAQYDVVILDAPPVLPVTDAALLSSLADGAIVIVRHGTTRGETLSQCMKSLVAVEAECAGVVINGVPRRRRGSPYEYHYSYGYDSDAQRAEKRRRPRGSKGERVRVEDR